METPDRALAMQRALLRTVQEIAKGMDYIHSFGIIHGDLKLGNVLLKTHRVDRRGYVAKVSDFGRLTIPPAMAKFTDHTSTDVASPVRPGRSHMSSHPSCGVCQERGQCRGRCWIVCWVVRGRLTVVTSVIALCMTAPKIACCTCMVLHSALLYVGSRDSPQASQIAERKTHAKSHKQCRHHTCILLQSWDRVQMSQGITTSLLSTMYQDESATRVQLERDSSAPRVQ